MKIIKSYDWNNHHYVVIEDDVLGRVPLKCQDKDVESVVNNLRELALKTPEEPKTNISGLTDDELVAEVKKRNIQLYVRGEAK